jgi:phosphoribosylanthranilate isomerase
MKGIWKERDVPFIQAGGHTPDNVREAIRAASPEGVDVSSGVEMSPGIKDPLKVARFIREAKS